MKITHSLIVFDLETTGTWIKKDRIIEIAMVKISPSGVKETYHQRLNPLMPIPLVVEKLTGICDDDVKDQPTFPQIAQKVVSFIADSDIAGFNVENFDIPLLKRELDDAGVEFSFEGRKIYDAQKVFHLNEKRDLTAAYTFYCDQSLQGAHSALVDTLATWEVLQAQVKKYGGAEASLSFLEQFDYPAPVDFFDSEKKFRWWNGELYMMFGKYRQKESLRTIARKDPSYLQWILSGDFTEEIKELVANALRGSFPQPPL